MKKDNWEFPDDEILFVGFSKGGAEAVANAVATNKPAIVFNPATVRLSAYDLDYDNYDSEITKYVVDGEALNYLFRGVASAPGKEIVLNKEPKWKKILNDLSFANLFSLIITLNDAKNKHYLESIYEAIRKEK